MSRKDLERSVTTESPDSHAAAHVAIDTAQPPMAAVLPPKRRRPGAGRPPTHGLATMRKSMAQLTTERLDQRSAVAVAARRFTVELTADVGGDPSRAQATLIELAARTWIIVEALDDFLMRQPSLVTKKRTVVPVLLQRQQLADSLARMLERLGLERRAKDVTDLASYLAKKPSTTPTDARSDA